MELATVKKGTKKMTLRLDELEEDYADARAGEAAWEEYIASGRKSISLEEYAKKWGIDLDD